MSHKSELQGRRTELAREYGNLTAAAARARSAASQVVDNQEGDVAVVLADVFTGAKPESAGAKAINEALARAQAARTAGERARMFAEAAAEIEQRAAEVGQAIKVIDQHIRSIEAGELRALGAAKVEAYKSAVHATVSALAEVYAVADLLAPHCPHSAGNIAANEQWQRAVFIDAPLDCGSQVTPETMNAARERVNQIMRSKGIL